VNTHKFDTWVQVIHKKLWIAKVAHALTVALNWVIHALTVAGSRINGGASIYNLYSLYLNAPVVAQAQTVHKFQPAKTAGVSTPPCPPTRGGGTLRYRCLSRQKTKHPQRTTPVAALPKPQTSVYRHGSNPVNTFVLHKWLTSARDTSVQGGKASKKVFTKRCSF